MAGFTSVSEKIESARRFQEMLSAQVNSALVKEVPKKHKLAKDHYPKEFLIAVHQQAKLERNQIGEGYMYTTPDKVSASKQTVSDNLDIKKYLKYTKMKIRDLVVGGMNQGRILYARTVVDRFSLVALHTVIEDAFGGACQLCVYNLTEEKGEKFKLGVDLAIINPYYKKARDGMNTMRVDNPAEILFIQKPSSPSTLPLSPIQYKDEGNKLFKERRYSEAVLEYTQAIAGDGSDPTYLSNRSLCYIRLGQFEFALSDAQAAVAINPTVPKFRYRQAMSWSGLGNHAQAKHILKELIDETAHANNLEFRDKLSQETLYLEQQLGIFDFRKIEDLAMSRLPNQIADFIGPMEIGISMVNGCAERGLFTTRDIKKGEVIHLSKAAVFLGDFTIDLSNVVEANVDALDANPPPFRILASKLIDKMNVSPLFASRVLNVIEDGNSKSSPFYTNIDLYTYKGYEEIQSVGPPKFSLEQIRYITTKKSYYSAVNGSNNSTNISQMYEDVASGRATYGFWFIPSLLNHSCLGNVVSIIKGEISVLKTLRDVKKGEELLFSRFDAAYFMTLEDRTKSLQTIYGYQCHCQLCEYESQKETRPILKRVRKLARQVRKFTDQYASTHTCPLRPLIPIDQFRNYASRAVELAEQLEMGPYTFCGTLWSAFIDLTCVWILKENELLNFFQQIEKYICEREAYHQDSYWKNYQNFCLCTLGAAHPLTLQVSKRFTEFDKLFEWK